MGITQESRSCESIVDTANEILFVRLPDFGEAPIDSVPSIYQPKKGPNQTDRYEEEDDQRRQPDVVHDSSTPEPESLPEEVSFNIQELSYGRCSRVSHKCIEGVT